MILLLLVWLFVGMGICHDANAFNGAETPKLALQIALVSLVAETRDHQGFECIATDIRILRRLVELGGVVDQRLGSLLFLTRLAITSLEPTLGRVVDVSLCVFAQLWKVLREAVDVRRLAVLWRVIRRLDPSQGRARREKREQIRGQAVGHLVDTESEHRLNDPRGL